MPRKTQPKAVSNNVPNLRAKNTVLFSKPVYIVLFACVLVTFLCYVPSLTNGWTNWDDNVYVYENEMTKNLSWGTLAQFFSTYQVGNYHPLAMLSLGIDYRLFEMNATGFHVHALVLHLLNTVLVFVFIWLLSGRLWASAITSLLFGIHPAHVESVAWISERKDLLYVFYYLAGLITYTKYVQSGRKYLFYGLTLLLFCLSLLAKGQAVTFSVALLLVDYYLRRPFNLKLLLEKIPFFSLSLVIGIVAVYAQKSAGAVSNVAHYSPLRHVIFGANSALTYFYKSLLPFNLSAFYPIPKEINVYKDIILFASPVLLLLLFAAVIYSMRKGRTIAFGFAFFFINILLILQIVGVGGAIMADRYTYLSYTGLFFVFGISATKLMDNNPAFKLPVLALLAVVTLFFGFKTIERTKVWESSKALYEDMLQESPANSAAWNNLGLYYVKAGDNKLALQHFNKAIEMRPGYVEPIANRANIYDAMGEHDSAIAGFTKVIQLNPGDYTAFIHRGKSYRNKGMMKEAIADMNHGMEHWKKAQIGKPYDGKGESEFYATLGDAYEGLKQYNLADSCFALAFKLDRDNFDAMNNYAYYLAERPAKLELAATLAKKVVEANPENVNAYDTYAWVLYKQKNYVEAKAWLNKALQKSDNKNAAMLEHYGDVLFAMKDTNALTFWIQARQNGNTSIQLQQKMLTKGNSMEQHQ